MKFYRKLLLSAAVCFLAACAFATDFTKVHSYAHQIQEETILGAVQCSATAIGPHAILTASHCELPTKVIGIDGQPAEVKGIIRDDLDHTIYIVDAKFDSFAPIGGSPKLGEDVFLFGNPGEVPDVLRKGYVARANPETPAILYDFNGFYGDSGAGIFDKHGNLVDVASAVFAQGDKDSGVSMKIMVGFPLAFTPDQLAQAQAE